MSSRLQAVRVAAARFAFHRDQHHGWRRAAAWLLVCNVLTALAFAGYVWFHSTVYIAVAATPDGRLVRLTPLDEPIMSDAALRNWTVSAVTGDNQPLSMVVWSYVLTSEYGQASAVAAIMIALMAPILVVYWTVARRTGIVPTR